MSPAAPLVDPFTAVADLRARGVPFVLATVVRAVSPTSAKPGDKALLTESGVLTGWIGGSCAEPIVRKEAQAALRDGECRLVHISPDATLPEGRAGLSVHRMECYSGGALEIYIEPYLPLPTLLVFGNSPVARALCDLGRLMGYRVTVVDLGDRPSLGDDLDIVRRLDALPPFDPSATYAVVSSHGVFDEESLEKAVALDLPYTGLVTSRKRRDQVFEALRARGIPDERLARVSAPAGIELGARQPQEIALSVMAQIVAIRRGVLGASDAVPAAPPAAPAQARASRAATTSANPADVAHAPGGHACCHGSSGANTG